MPIRLLVADECSTCLYGLQALVRTTSDFNMVGATRDGEAAVQLAKSLEPDILLLGVDLRSLNGLAVMTRVRYENPRIRGVFLAGARSAELEPLGLEAGAVAWVSKGVEPEALLKLLRDVHAGHVPPRNAAARLAATPGTFLATPLSRREVTVLRHAVLGWTSQEIASFIDCRPRTVDKHLDSIRRKFGVRHPRAVIAAGLIYLRYADLSAENARGPVEQSPGDRTDPLKSDDPPASPPAAEPPPAP